MLKVSADIGSFPFPKGTVMYTFLNYILISAQTQCLRAFLFEKFQNNVYSKKYTFSNNCKQKCLQAAVININNIKSKERVSKHGEVFTGNREVVAMVDLIKDEADRIDSRFLEPACGNGNFLVEVLGRKLSTVKRLYGKKQSYRDYEKYSLIALSSIYGVDILEDNAQECRKRLYDEWNGQYSEQCSKEANDECREAARYIIQKNILCGDALTLLRKDGTPIVFAQWDLVMGSKVKRHDFRLDELMHPLEETLDGNSYEGLAFDEETKAWVPKPIKEYPLVNYWEVQYWDEDGCIY